MTTHYDYLHIERHEQNPGSFLDKIKKLVAGIRYIRQNLQIHEVRDHMPTYWKLEEQLNSFLESIGENKRQWIEEIMIVLDNEPEPDPTTSFKVFEVLTVDEKLTLIDTGYSFDQNIFAEEWIRESSPKGNSYTVIKFIQRDETNKK